MEPAIQTRNLTRMYGEFVAVSRVDLDVPQGTIYGYIGLNGAGKTTTIKMLTTLIEPTAGTARVAGHDVTLEALAVRAAIGLVGDEAGASRPSWTPGEYIGYYARLRGLSHVRRRVKDALDLVGIEPAWRGRALALHSTGMKRRVEIARALLGRPRVLFLDEPTRGLDLPAKRTTWDLLRRLARDGMTIFLSSHEVAEIQALCTRLAVIAGGRLTYEGPASGLGREPARFEADLLRLLKGGVSKPSKQVQG